MNTYSLINKDDNGHSFVNGNTKFLKDMDQKELEILAKNGDPRIKVAETKDEPEKKPKAITAATPAA